MTKTQMYLNRKVNRMAKELLILKEKWGEDSENYQIQKRCLQSDIDAYNVMFHTNYYLDENGVLKDTT